MINKKIYLIQLGCASNVADSMRIIKKLQIRNIITQNINDADVVIVMTCGFSKKQYWESIQRILEIKKNNKTCAIWVGGCVPAINKTFTDNFTFSIDKIFKPREIEDIFTIKRDYNVQIEFDYNKYLKTKLNYFPIRIQNGCTENCSYCVIKRAGGKTKSKLISDIITENINVLVNYKMIGLVGEEIGSYGIDNGEDLKQLIFEILNINSKIKINFSAIHPKYFINNYDMYKEIYDYDNITRILPIPIQSASNRVLRLMHRDYNIDEVKDRINELMHIYPELKLSTDIMVGYPGEGKDDFLLSQKFVNEMNISSLDCFKYDDMRNSFDTVSEDVKLYRLKLIALTFIKKYCKGKNISNYYELEKYLTNNILPINMNI